MLLQNSEFTDAQLRQKLERCERFAAPTAEAIGAAQKCLFSVLPYEERFRQASSWYEACTQAMLRANYAPLDDWIRQQACMAAEENFELDDLLHLLRICRRSAIEVEHWDEDAFYHVDEIINEGLLAIRSKVPWSIPDGLNYLQQSESKPTVNLNDTVSRSVARVEGHEDERREFGRNRVALPIRVRSNKPNAKDDEVTSTRNVSRGGLYFKTQATYRVGATLQVTYPYWTGPGSINREYTARVTRVDNLPDQSFGVALEFLQNLRYKST